MDSSCEWFIVPTIVLIAELRWFADWLAQWLMDDLTFSGVKKKALTTTSVLFVLEPGG